MEFKCIRCGSYAFKFIFDRGRVKLSRRSVFKWEDQRVGGRFLLGEVYLFLSQGLQLFRLALPVVFHDHHGGVDFAHRQVCGC